LLQKRKMENSQIKKDDQVIGKAVGVRGIVGRCIEVNGSGSKRRFTIAFQNGETRVVAKRSIDLYSDSATVPSPRMSMVQQELPEKSNLNEDGSIKSSDSDSSNNSSSSDSDTE
jgi:hypothetical protein